VSPAIADGERTHLERAPIDAALAARQHSEYEAALRELGCDVVRLPATAGHPDAVFIEDTAVVFDELAVVTRPGAASRRGETPAVAEALAAHRPVASLAAPARLDGGDVLRVGRTVFVGRSGRTDAAGIAALGRILEPAGYDVREVRVTGCLHLKSAATFLSEDALLVNPRWIDPDELAGFRLLEVDPAEPRAANVLAIGDRAIVSATHPRTRARIEAEGLTTIVVDLSELELAEAGVTCGSLVFPRGPGPAV
jgi:dimethylargininase